MTSHRPRDNNRSTFTPKNPHFFKVILQSSIRDGILGMPRKFVRKYGNQLPNTVKLEVPSGAKWQVELTKSDNRVWLQKGWKEFAEYYSLDFGSFVVFQYKGKDHFNVLIFDRTALEIKYPYTTDDVSRKRKSDLSSPLPQKKTRTDSMLEDLSSQICLDDPNFGKLKLRNLKKNENLGGSSENDDGVGVVSARQYVKMEGLSCSQVLTNTEKAQAIQIASAFKSAENPVFMVVMRPSSVCYGYNMVIPMDFAMKFLPGHTCNLTLCNSAGKTWSVTYYRNAESNKSTVKLYGGWRAFVEDNRLKVGDICAFELIKHPEICLKVFIYPVVKNASMACSSQAKHGNGGASGAWGCLKPELTGKMQPMTSTGKQKAADVASRSSSRLVSRKSKEKSNFPCPLPRKKLRTDSPNEHGRNSKLEVLSTGISPGDSKCRNNLRNLRKVEISPGQLNAQGSVETEAFSCVQQLTASRKAHAVQIASAKGTKNPVFVVVMQPSYLNRMFIPSDFARKFLTVDKSTLIFCNSAGKTWPVKYRCNPGCKDPKAYICGGWPAFVADNDLGLGDICIFELIKHPEILMKVVIYPSVKNTSKACKPLAHGSIASRVKTRSLVSDTKPNCRRSPCPSSSREFKYPTDAYVEILDDSPLTSPCFQPGTTTRTNRSGSIQAKGIKLEKQKKSMNSQYVTK